MKMNLVSNDYLCWKSHQEWTWTVHTRYWEVLGNIDKDNDKKLSTLGCIWF